jgi:hypothetical protein
MVNMIEEIEPIVLVFPNLGTRVELPTHVAAHVWDAFRRGLTNNLEEYVHQLLERALTNVETKMVRALSHEDPNKPEST